jgi:hypothetical protein
MLKYKITDYKTPINIDAIEYQMHTEVVIFNTKLYDYIYCFTDFICSHII